METTASIYPWPLLKAAGVLVIISALDGPTGLEAKGVAYELVIELAKEGYHEEQQLSDLLRYTLDQTEDRLDETLYAKSEGFLDHVNSTVRAACVRLNYKLCSSEPEYVAKRTQL